MGVASSRKIRIVLACICGAVALTSAYFLWRHLHSVPGNELTLYGNVDIRQVDLGFRVGGRIAEVLVDEGDLVQEGQPLAKLDSDILKQQRDQAQAKVDAQKADLAKLERGYRSEEIAQASAAVSAAKAQAENSSINLRRVQSMRAANAISQKELDNARAQDREATARLRSAQDNLDMLSSGYRAEDILAQKAALEAAQAELELAEIYVEDAVLKAPQKGIVLTRAREAGAIVQTGQTVYTLTLNDPVWLRAYISEPYLGLIKPGMPVRISIDSYPDRQFAGNIGFISPEAEFTPKTVETKDVRTNLVYRLRIRVDDPDDVMRQGMPVTVHIEVSPNAR